MGLMSMFEAMMIKQSLCFLLTPPHSFLCATNSDRVSQTYSVFTYENSSSSHVHESYSNSLEHVRTRIRICNACNTKSHGHHVEFMECGQRNFRVNKLLHDKFIKVYTNIHKPDVLCIIYLTITQFVLQLFIAFLDS